MGRSCLLFILLLLSLLELSVSSGYRRKEMRFGRDSTVISKANDKPRNVEMSLHSASYQQRREMKVMIADYADPGANINPGNDPFVPPPPPPPAARN